MVLPDDPDPRSRAATRSGSGYGPSPRSDPFICTESVLLVSLAGHHADFGGEVDLRSHCCAGAAARSGTNF